MSYIDRQALLEKLKYMGDYNIDMDYVTAEDIMSIPSADVRENVHGEWIYDGDQIICSKCRTAFNFISLKTATKFCAECGADMRGKAE